VPSRPLRIGTRGSPMALRQTAIVRDRLAAAHPDLAAAGAVEIVTIRTTGDRVQDRRLAEIGDKVSCQRDRGGAARQTARSRRSPEARPQSSARTEQCPHFPPWWRQRQATNSTYSPAICNPLNNSCKFASKLGRGLDSGFIPTVTIAATTPTLMMVVRWPK